MRRQQQRDSDGGLGVKGIAKAGRKKSHGGWEARGRKGAKRITS